MRGKIIAGAVVALGLVSSPAFAVTDLGNLNPDDAASFNDTFVKGAVLSERTFELTSDADTSISTTIAVNKGSMYTPGTLSLYLGAAIPADLVAPPVTLTLSGHSYVADLNLELLPSTKDYLVVITGTNNVKSLGVGTSILTSSVPEPATWAMMVIGFMGLGYAAFRRGAKGRALAI
jgi:hypothetical protein